MSNQDASGTILILFLGCATLGLGIVPALLTSGYLEGEDYRREIEQLELQLAEAQRQQAETQLAQKE